MTATDGGVSLTSARTGTLYVEKLISQNRNYIVSIDGPDAIAPGQTVTYVVTAHTASTFSDGEVVLVFPKGYDVQSVANTYSEVQNSGFGTTDGPWADGCRPWLYDYTGADSPGTAQCTDIHNGQGKDVTSTYVVKVPDPVASGEDAFDLQALIYDFSGSSFHYNADFGAVSKHVRIAYPLDVTVNGDGEVNEIDPGSGIDCGAVGTDCDETYDPGTNVKLKATPNGTETFTGWGDDTLCAEYVAPGPYTGDECTVAMTEARSVVANFSGTSYVPLDASVIGYGSVSGSTGSIACSNLVTTACKTTTPVGATTTLTATPGVDPTGTPYVFTGWADPTLCSESGGDPDYDGPTCTVTMSVARSVRATFVAGVTLTYDPTPTGGTVTDSRTCTAAGALCANKYNLNDPATITATPKPGYRFKRWKGACAGQTSATCTLTMDDNKFVTAEFEPTSSRSTRPNLQITVTSSRTRTRTGQTVRVRLRVRNIGGAAATQARTCLAIPRGFTVVSPTANVSGGRVCFSAATIAAGGSKTYPVTLRATRSGTAIAPFRGTARAENATTPVHDVASTQLVPRGGGGESPTG